MRGVYTGRAVGSTKAQPARARQLRDKGLTTEEIATALGISSRTVRRHSAVDMLSVPANKRKGHVRRLTERAAQKQRTA